MSKEPISAKLQNLRRGRRYLNLGEQPEEAAVAGVKIQVVLPDGSRLGPGKIALLEAIDTVGTLSGAAQKLNISYRHAWLFVQQINSSFSQPAVMTFKGISQLSEFGRHLIATYRQLEDEARAAGAAHLAWFDANCDRSDKTAL